jgi:hypothetical protein
MSNQSQKNKEYYKKYPWKRTLVDIKTRCNNKNHIRYDRYGGRGIKCRISESELKELWFRDKAWLLNQASIDREDNDGDYVFDNCRYMELSENSSIANQGIKLKPVIQYDLDGNFIRDFVSIREAEIKLNKYKSAIGKCCSGIYKTMYGYKWKYKLDTNT